MSDDIKDLFCHCDGETEVTVDSLRELPDQKKTELLFYAMMRGSVPLFEMLIEAGVDVDEPLQQGVTPLLYACQEGNLEMAKQLSRAGAMRLARCDRGFSAVTYAVLSRSVPMVEWALKLGCDLNQPDNQGTSIFHAAVAKSACSPEEEEAVCSIIGLLKANGAEVPRWPPAFQIAAFVGLEKAARLLRPSSAPSLWGHGFRITAMPEQTRMLLELGADPNEPESEEHTTPLADALMAGCFESAELLIEHGADIHCVTDSGWTLLHHLAYFSRDEDGVAWAKRLIEMGVDVNAVATGGKTALDFAKSRSNLPLQELIEQHSAKK